MARGLNKVMLIGRLGADPEVKYLPSGGAVTNVSLATSDQWKDKTSGERQERTEWHRIVAFNRLAEIMGEYLRKGSQVYVEGRLQTRKWQAQDGRDNYTTEIVVSDMQMLESKSGGGGYDNSAQMGGGAQAPRQSGNMGGGQYASQQPKQQQSQPSQQPRGGQSQSAPPPNFDDFEDDIPF